MPWCGGGLTAKSIANNDMPCRKSVFLLTAPVKRFIVAVMNLTTLETSLEKTFWNFNSFVVMIKDNYNFSYLNSYGINLLGYQEDEILAMSFIELLTPDSLEKCIENIRHLRETSFCKPFIVNLVKRSGDIVSLELTGLKLPDSRFFFTGRNLSMERIRKERMQYLEDLNTHVLNSIGEGIVVLDPKANIIKFNDFMEKQLRWDKSFIGKNVFKKFPDLKHFGLLEAFVTIIDKGVTLKKERITGKSDNGMPTVFNFTGYPLRRKKEVRGVVVVIEDITKREVISSKMKKAVDLREKMHQIIENIVRLKTPPEILGSVVRGLQTDIGYEQGGIFLIDESTSTPAAMKLFTSSHHRSEISTAAKKFAKGIRMQKGQMASVFKEGKPTIISDVKRKKRSSSIFPGTESEIIVPIRLKERSIGMMVIESKSNEFFDETDLTFLEMLANAIAITLEKIKFLEDLLNKARYLSIIYETGQVLQKSPKGKARFNQVLSHLSENLEDCMILVVNFDDGNHPSIIADWGTSNGIRDIFSKASKHAKQEIMKSVRNGNPFIVENIKGSVKGLAKKLQEQTIKCLYIFPFIDEERIAGGLIVLSRQPAALQKSQISFLTAVANQLSVYAAK
jgi:PAS domain S-box-containing protein